MDTYAMSGERLSRQHERTLIPPPMQQRSRPVDQEEQIDRVWRHILALTPDQRLRLMRRLSRPECT